MKGHPFCRIPIQSEDYVCECELIKEGKVMTEFDFVGSTVICQACRKEFELEENDLFRCEECQ